MVALLCSYSSSHVLVCAKNSVLQVLMVLGLSLKPERIDHSNSPLKWSILLQHFNLSVVNPIQFHAFNLFLFPAS